MNRKDARFGATRAPRWKVRLSFVLSALAMLAVCVAVRYFWGTRSATAQPPARPAASGAKPTFAGATPAKAAAKAGSGAAADPRSAEEQKMAIMAVVNGEQITRQDLARECLLRYGTDVLETLVNKHLIMAACKQRGIGVTQQEVDDEINHMAAKFGLSADRWMQLLEEQRNVNPQQYAKDIVWPTLALRKLAADKIQVTPEEMRRGMESEFGPRVRVRIIIAATRENAEQLRAAALADPESFGNLAKEHSVDRVSASARGMVPAIKKHTGDPALEKAAFALKEGSISAVIGVANQFWILKCDKHDGPVYIAPEHKKDAAARLRDQLSDKKLKAAGESLFKQLQAESKVVNVYNDEKLRQQAPGVAATINGGQITIRQLSEECLTRHGLSVVDGEINRLLIKQELAKRQVTVSKEDLDAEVVRAAKDYGFVKNGHVNVDDWLKKVTEEEGATVELYMKDAVWPTVALKNLVGGTVKVSREDLDKAFEANFGERVEVLAIVLASQRQATTVWDMARNDPTDKFYAQLASQYSIEPASKANGGKVPPIQRHGGQPKLEDEAFKLKPGELSSIVAVEDKFIIMRCQGRTKPVSVKRAEVEGELHADLMEKKLRMAMGKEFDRLKEGGQVDNFLAGTSHTPKPAKTAKAPGASSPLRGAPLGPAQGPSSGVAPAGFKQPGPSDTGKSPTPGAAPRASSGIRPAGQK